MARLRGELKELPSSCGGSLAVSLTVSRSEKKNSHKLLYLERTSISFNESLPHMLKQINAESTLTVSNILQQSVCSRYLSLGTET